MTPSPFRRSLPLAILLLAPLARAHEFWIEPSDFTLEPDEPLVAELADGQDFSARYLPYSASRYPSVTIAGPDGVRAWRGEDGARPAIRAELSASGLHVIALESIAGSTVHDTLEEFTAFAVEEGAPGIAARHREAGLPRTRILELFTRHAKTLVSVGEAGGEDRPLGLELEIVALTDPYEANAPDAQPFRLLLDGEGLADTQVSVFHKAEGEAAAEGRDTIRTDESGRFEVETARSGHYLVSAVLLRRPAPSRMLDTGALWESLWASMTFAR